MSPVRIELNVSALGRIPRLSISSRSSKACSSRFCAMYAEIPTLKVMTSGTTPGKPCAKKHAALGRLVPIHTRTLSPVRPSKYKQLNGAQHVLLVPNQGEFTFTPSSSITVGVSTNALILRYMKVLPTIPNKRKGAMSD